jgi:hypothetical protein
MELEEAGKKLVAGIQKAIEERYWNFVFVLTKRWNYEMEAEMEAKAESKEKHGVLEPIPELTIYNLTLCPLQSRLQHIYHGQPYARVDFIPQSGTLDLASGDLQETRIRREVL